jgi:hypothetical protein
MWFAERAQRQSTMRGIAGGLALDTEQPVNKAAQLFVNNSILFCQFDDAVHLFQ